MRDPPEPQAPVAPGATPDAPRPDAPIQQPGPGVERGTGSRRADTGTSVLVKRILAGAALQAEVETFIDSVTTRCAAPGMSQRRAEADRRLAQ